MNEKATIANALNHQPDQPIATSRSKAWNSLTVDIHGAVKNFELDAPALDHHLVIFTPHGGGRMLQRRAGTSHEAKHTAGNVILMPAGYACYWRGTASPTVRLRMNTELFSRASDELGRGPNNCELLNVFHTRDRLIGDLSGLFCAELERAEHPSQQLVLDAASHLLAAHLLRSYNVFDQQKQASMHGLTPRMLSTVIAYMEENSTAPVRLADLASLADVSRFHFARMFKKSTGVTPMVFLEQIRIRKAKELICTGRHSLSEVAILVGFADQSHFCRRFKLHVQCTPAEYARRYAWRESPFAT